MDVITGNLWLSVGLGVLLVIFWLLTSAGEDMAREHQFKKQFQMGGSGPMTALILATLVSHLEDMMAQHFGRHFPRSVQHKIATGMLAVMVAREIPVEQITRDRMLFLMVMMESIETLQRAGEISI